MKLRILLGVVVLALAWFLLRPGLDPIGGGWAISHSRIGSSQSLVRIGVPASGRTTVSSGVTAYRFFTPDCVVYTATSSFDGHVFLAACGDRAPITVGEDFYKLTPFGLRYSLRGDTFDGIPKVTERHIPIGRILAEAKRAPAYSSSRVPRTGQWRRVPITYAHYPDGLEQLNEKNHTAVHDAVSAGDVGLLSSWLEQGVFPDLLDDAGVTPLMLTVVMQSDTGLAPVLADTLLKSGADVDAQTKTGMTALMFAKRAGATNVYNMLIEWGADTTLTNRGGQTAGKMETVPGYDPLSRGRDTTAASGARP